MRTSTSLQIVNSYSFKDKSVCMCVSRFASFSFRVISLICKIPLSDNIYIYISLFLSLSLGDDSRGSPSMVSSRTRFTGYIPSISYILSESHDF